MYPKRIVPQINHISRSNTDKSHDFAGKGSVRFDPYRKGEVCSKCVLTVYVVEDNVILRTIVSGKFIASTRETSPPLPPTRVLVSRETIQATAKVM